MTGRRSGRGLSARRRIAAAAAAVALVPTTAFAQAWTPPARVGAVAIVVEGLDQAGHQVDDGRIIPDGKSVNVDLAARIEYAFTDRLAVAASLPYVLSKYRGPDGPPPGIPFLSVDSCFCWHGDVQDVTADVRYNAVNLRRRFVVTPEFGVVVPSHAYPYKGEAVPGRDLREVRVGVEAGVRLDAISPRLFVSGRYAYGFVERVLGIDNDRSLYGGDAAFAVTRRFSVQGFVAAQQTHGGLRFPDEIVGYPDRVAEHDRLLRDDYVHAGGGAAYAWRSIEIDGSVELHVWGRNTHVVRAYTISVRLPFERAAPKPHK